jgi:hypothetical protein
MGGENFCVVVPAMVVSLPVRRKVMQEWHKRDFGLYKMQYIEP